MSEDIEDIDDMSPRMRHIFETAQRELEALSQSDSDNPSWAPLPMERSNE